MKILHYTYDDVANPRCGGGGAYRELLLHQALAGRHEIHFYTGWFRGAQDGTRDGLRHVHLGFGNSYLVSRITFALYATVHSLFAKADLVVIGFSAFSPVLTFLFRPRSTVIQFYHFVGREPFRKYGVFGIVPWMAERLVLRCARNLVTMADSVADSIRRRRGGKVNVTATYTGFDRALLREGQEDGRFILSFGRLDVHMKGLDILIPAFEQIAPRFPDHRLIIAGRGTEQDLAWLERRVADSSCSGRITLINGVTYEKKLALFETASLVSIPSRFEGFCIVAVEAAASSRATVGSRILGLQDAIKENETGLLVPPEDPAALADGMARLLTDGALRLRLGRAGYQWAQNFTWERISALQDGFYRTVRESAGKYF